jgi:dTDP-glucose 4,6-dehydratase
VDDLVEGIYRLLMSDYAGPVNIGNPDEITINQFGKEILELTSSSSKIIYTDLPKDDPKQRKPDISLAKELLDWQPKVSRLEGLKRTLSYFEEEVRNS